MISIQVQVKLINIIIIQVLEVITDVYEAKQFYSDFQHFVIFSPGLIIEDGNAKVESKIWTH